MKKSIGYYILLGATWPMQLFPLEFHYLFSDLLYLLVYRVARYRKNVVSMNLKNSFPEKSEKEKKEIEKAFYHSFCDMFIETLYFTHLNVQKEEKRLQIEGLDKVEEYMAKGKNIIVVTGHFGNWELLPLFIQKFSVRTYFVYKRLTNKTFDQFYRELRSRAAIPLEMKQTFRQLITDKRNKNTFAALMISDQRPLKNGIRHWLTFMNQDTPVMLGTEKIARKTDAAVFYLEVKQIKRGYHKATFELLFEEPAQTSDYEITDGFMKRLEKSISESPHQYLWTHKRWKYKKEKSS
ncbi:MAG: lysophospholipid acyltransferase family protein [Prolixibacteraceae bacterium]|jgi:KDO2-lipid IV(A) lauroyltransferase|nr:lysophospholipid acyltransferase family protein [Prolixibacteraceae bacterium]